MGKTKEKVEKNSEEKSRTKDSNGPSCEKEVIKKTNR